MMIASQECRMEQINGRSLIYDEKNNIYICLLFGCVLCLKSLFESVY